MSGEKHVCFGCLELSRLEHKALLCLCHAKFFHQNFFDLFDQHSTAPWYLDHIAVECAHFDRLLDARILDSIQ